MRSVSVKTKQRSQYGGIKTITSVTQELEKINLSRSISLTRLTKSRKLAILKEVVIPE